VYFFETLWAERTQSFTPLVLLLTCVAFCS
jgi:hypothetical protein